MTHVHIDGEIVITGLPAKTVERMRWDLSITNPVYQRAKRMGFETGDAPDTIESLVDMPDGSVHVPRGALAIVKDAFRRDGLTWRVDEDARTTGQPIWSRPPATPSLRDYQQEGVDKIAQHLQGLIVLPCGTGKSRLGIAAIQRINRTALVTVPTEDLVDQWCDALQELLGITAGRVGGGLLEMDRDVVVGIPNTLVKILEETPELGRQFGLVIIDECHNSPIRTFSRMVRLLPAKWRLLLTATPKREDGLEKLMHWSAGQTLMERTTADMIRLGWLSAGEVDVVETGWSFSYRGPDSKRLSTMDRELSEDLGRNSLIADRVAKDAKAGETVLVLANRKTMVKELSDMLALRGVAVTGVTSSTQKKKRKGTIADLRSGDLSVMVATSLADTGLDIARLSRVHLAYPQRAKGGTTQRLGRMLRLFPGKKPRLIDYVDSKVPTLLRRAKDRMRVFRECGLVP